MENKKGTASILVAAVLWGIISIFVKNLSAMGLTSMQISAVRSLIAPLFLIPFLYIKDKRLIFINPRDWYYFFATGIFSLLFFNWCYFNTINASSASVAAVLLYTAPIFVILMSAVIFKEKLTIKKLAALVFTFTGCVLVSGILSQTENIGSYALLSGLGSGFGYALYSIFGRFALKKYSPFTVTLWTVIFCGCGSLIISAAQSGFSFPSEVFSITGIICSIGVSVVCCALPYMLYTWGLQFVESGRAAILSTVEPAVAAVVGIFIFHEQITAIKGIGMMMIFLSAFILAKSE